MRAGRTVRAHRSAARHRAPARRRTRSPPAAGPRRRGPLAARPRAHRARRPASTIRCWRPAAAVLPRLREITGESVQLYRREGTSRVCVAALEPPAGLRDTVPVGTRLPMTAGSGAKVLLAYSDAATQQAVLPTRQVHRPDAGRGAQARLGTERRRARAGRGECVGAGTGRPRHRDRRGLGVGSHRPDGPQTRRALGS